LNCVEIEREGLFVAEKMHKKKKRNGGGREDGQFPGHKLNIIEPI
jgi:hypothetical protein